MLRWLKAVVVSDVETLLGAAACSEIETPRLMGGIGLALLGITGLGVAGLLPSSRNGERVRGADHLFRVDDIPALDHPVLGENPEDEL